MLWWISQGKYLVDCGLRWRLFLTGVGERPRSFPGSSASTRKACDDFRSPTLQFTSALRRSLALVLAFTSTAAAQAPPSAAPGWNDIPTFEMRAGLEAYWDVFDRTEGAHRNEALKRGFQPVSIYNTFADYPGGQRENVDRHIAAQNFNPWNKPTFFERIIKRNIDVSAPKGLFVHDIEPVLERNPRVAWNWPELRA